MGDEPKTAWSNPFACVGDMAGTQERRGFWAGPLPWLIYLPFYFLPWFGRMEYFGPWQMGASALGVGVFLVAYLGGYRRRGGPRLLSIVAIQLVGMALAPLGGAWTTFSIYAGAMAGLLRPPPRAFLVIGILVAATAAEALLLRQPLLWWLPSLLLVAATGSGSVSREAFYERSKALTATQEEVRRLAGAAERERITRDLHDVIGRTLTLVALKADLAVKLSERDALAAQAEMQAVAQAARAGLAEVRIALAGQAGGSLAHEAAASVAALEAAGVSARLVGDPARIPANAGAVLAMTLREAVTNIIRHAQARSCTIEVALGEGEARLSVSDDGIGGTVVEGQGLTGMRQRLAAAGGALALQDARPGVRLVASVPA